MYVWDVFYPDVEPMSVVVAVIGVIRVRTSSLVECACVRGVIRAPASRDQELDT